MPIHVHKAIESLKKFGDHFAMPFQNRQCLLRYADFIGKCVPFDFGEFNYSDFEAIKDDAARCWNADLLQFPFPAVAFEHSWQLDDSQKQLDHIKEASLRFGLPMPKKTGARSDRSIYIVQSVDDVGAALSGWTMGRAYTHGAPGLIVSEFQYSSDAKPDSMGSDWWTPPSVIVGLTRNLAADPEATVVVGRDGDPSAKWLFEFAPAAWTPPEMREDIQDVMMANNFYELSSIIDTPVAMALHLTTRGIDLERVEEPVRLNKKRRAGGKPIIPEYHVVKIKPLADDGRRGLGETGGSHASPRPPLSPRPYPHP